MSSPSTLRAHRLDLDHVADDLEFLHLFRGAAHDLELHRRVDRAAHLVDRLVERHALGRIVVDRRDDVARHHARLGGRRVVDRADDLDQAVLLRHFDAETAELAVGLHLHVAIGLRVHVARVRVERTQHAVDRRFDQLRLVGLLDVVVANLLEHVAEQIELAIGVGGGGEGALRQFGQRMREDARSHGADRHAQRQIGNLASHPRAFSMSDLVHHGPESTAVSSFLSSI